jgi:hypothetical protein
VSYVPNPLGELHAELLGLRVLLDGGQHAEARRELAEVLDRWPVLVAEVYGTADPDERTPPLPGPYADAEARSGQVRVHVQVRIDNGPQWPACVPEVPS